MHDVVTLTRDLVRFDTVNPPGNEQACAAFVGRALEDAGFRTAAYESGAGRTTVVARLDGARGGPALCFTGHLDTVPVGAEPWQHDPFAGELVNGSVHGRGSSDMKGGLAALVVAAERLARAAPRPSLLLAFTAGEETGCEGAFHLVRSTDALRGVGAILVAEPTRNYPMVGHRGALWLEVRIRGRSAHGATPEQGVSAIYRAAHGIARLERLALSEADPLLGTASLNVGTIRGGTSVNVVPDLVTLGVDVRTLPRQGADDVRRALAAAFAADGEVEVETVLEVPGVLTPPDDPWVQLAFEVAAPLVGENPHARATAFFTDASALQQASGAPTVILGPGEPELAHRPDEACSVARLEAAVEAYVELGRRWNDELAPRLRTDVRRSAAC
ncbi:MAG: M20 family metallopeptidase [Thermodesulfobacteriota bacterium]